MHSDQRCDCKTVNKRLNINVFFQTGIFSSQTDERKIYRAGDIKNGLYWAGQYYLCENYFQGQLELIQSSSVGRNYRKRWLAFSLHAFFAQCSREEVCQKTLLKASNIGEIMKLLKHNFEEPNDELLTLLLGILWRCSLNAKHRKK